MRDTQQLDWLSGIELWVEWLISLNNHGTRRTYQIVIRDFVDFIMITNPEEFRIVTRSHVMAWREHLIRRELSASTVRHRLAGLSSFFEYLFGKGAVAYNPVSGVQRPKLYGGEGKAVADDDETRPEDSPTFWLTY